MSRCYCLQGPGIDANKEWSFTCLRNSFNGLPRAPERLVKSKLPNLTRDSADFAEDVFTISGSEPLVYKDLPLIPYACRTHEIPTTPLTFLNSLEQLC